MNREKKNETIEECFTELAGKKIKNFSIVVRMMDRKIYQVLAKDSKIAECADFFDLFEKPEEKAQRFIFEKKELCNYYDLINLITKRINKRIEEK